MCSNKILLIKEKSKKKSTRVPDIKLNDRVLMSKHRIPMVLIVKLTAKHNVQIILLNSAQISCVNSNLWPTSPKKTFLPDVNQPQGDMSSIEGDQQTQQGTIRTQRLHDKNTDPQNDALIKAGPKPADTQNIQILKLLKIMHKRLKIYHQQN